MNEQLKILEMIEKGQITAAEAMELLNALKNSQTDETPVLTSANPAVTDKPNYKYLKIKVTSDNNSINVNVNIPIRLLTTIGEIAEKMTVFVPDHARMEMEKKGINITDIDFARIIKDLLDGTLDDPNIVDVEAWDEEQKTNIKVKIYVE